MLEDRLLVWKFKGGSKDALRAIYEKYADDLLTLAANLLDDKIGAEDVVQDVFITFAESADRFRLTGSLKGFLAKCVANRSRDYLRRRRRRQTAVTNSADHKSAEVKSPVQLVISSEELTKLGSAMTELPYEQREAVVLHLHGDLRFRQIAKMQKVSTKTVQSRYRYGLDKLRSSMNGEVKR
ncbi:MAG: RNA polymerase sigma factor [Planctomycetota bacterium]|jgi:RNA polymerase sigma-70 factor (ECF subfamily)